MSETTKMPVLIEPSHSFTIYVAGEVADARRICRQFCMRGLCVTVTPTTFIYTAGAEEGVAVGLVNYPRFPSGGETIEQRAEELAVRLLLGLCQTSALIVGPQQTKWITNRELGGWRWETRREERE